MSNVAQASCWASFPGRSCSCAADLCDAQERHAGHRAEKRPRSAAAELPAASCMNKSSIGGFRTPPE
eukprot:5561735-Alexandrium_andersonii.AAC.1